MRVLALVCLLCCGCGVVKVAVRVPLAIATLGISEAIIQDGEDKRGLETYGQQLAQEVAAGRMDPVAAQTLFLQAASYTEMRKQSRNQVLGAVWGAAAKNSR